MTTPLPPAPPRCFDDPTALVLDKPAGLLSVPGRGELAHDSLAQRVQAEVPDALVVHRLDMATSGLLLMARGPDWQRHYSRLFADRQVHKRYEAVVQGLLADDQGEIDLPLLADWPNRPRQKVDPVQGKPALTRYQVLQRDTAHQHTRVALLPVTGRSHQLRVHLLALGHPILGDALYGDATVAQAAPRLLLHATQLVFSHPLDGRAVQVHSVVPF